MTRPINIDALAHNADWTKQTLDLFVSDGSGSFTKVETVEDLRLYLRLNGKMVEEFKALPAYYLALRKQVWLRDL